MSKKTQELILEILSEENLPALSSHSSNSYAPARQENFFENQAEGISSPFEGEGKSNDKACSAFHGIVVGRIKELSGQGQIYIDFPGCTSPDPIPARSIVHLGKGDLGQDVVLMFEEGDLRRPIIMGLLPSSPGAIPASRTEEKTKDGQSINVELDGNRLTLTAQKEIVLRCGKASITLTKAGKILIRGAYVSSRSSGPNLIKGGSVQLN